MDEDAGDVNLRGEESRSGPAFGRAALSFMSRDTLAGSMGYSTTQAERVRGMLAGRPGLTEKEMFGGIAFLLGGNMAVGVHGEDLIVRVDPAQTNALLREPGAKPFDLSGSRGPPAGWLLIAPSGYRTDSALRTWVGRGTAYASSLREKGPTKSKEKRERRTGERSVNSPDRRPLDLHSGGI